VTGVQIAAGAFVNQSKLVALLFLHNFIKKSFIYQRDGLVVFAQRFELAALVKTLTKILSWGTSFALLRSSPEQK